MSADAGLTFVDTNVLVYAYDVDAGWKHEVARTELERLWHAQSGVLSTQVLQEFYVTVTRRLSKTLPKQKARDVVGTYGAWPLHCPESKDILAASQMEERYHLSFWDALIIVSAQCSGARVLLSEDLQSGRRFGVTAVANPFRDRPAGGPPKEI